MCWSSLHITNLDFVRQDLLHRLRFFAIDSVAGPERRLKVIYRKEM